VSNKKLIKMGISIRAVKLQLTKKAWRFALEFEIQMLKIFTKDE
jgi:hypothetical protein